MIKTLSKTRYFQLVIVVAVVIFFGSMTIVQAQSSATKLAQIETLLNTIAQLRAQLAQLEGGTADTQKNIAELREVFNQAALAIKNKDIITINKIFLGKIKRADFLESQTILDKIFSDIKISEYVKLSLDDKQAILRTEIKVADGEYTVDQIFFIKQSGTWKFVVMNSRSLLSDDWFVDSDQDGRFDDQETCLSSSVSKCKKTDPNKSDTNGNGWWDKIDNHEFLRRAGLMK